MAEVVFDGDEAVGADFGHDGLYAGTPLGGEHSPDEIRKIAATLK